MVVCELCGADVQTLKETKIAGTHMKVCNNCIKHGQAIEIEPNKAYMFKKKIKSDEKSFDVKKNAPSIINSELSKKGLTVHHLARSLNIKQSSLLKYTTGKLKLDVETARKIERFLETSLVEEVEVISTENYMSEDDDSFSGSLGDLLKKSMK